MTMLRIIPRAEWGARYPNGAGTAPLPAPECWLHHSVTTPPDTTAPYDDDIAAIRTLEQIGQDRFGQGMSYTWLITPAGFIFEGHSVGRLGAHTAGRNSRARAICLVGNYEVTGPTPAQLLSAAWLLQTAAGRGWLTTARLSGGHRDVSQTACPGRYAYAQIGTINTRAAGPPITEEDDVLTTQDKLDIAAAVWGMQLGNGHAQANLTVANGNTWYIRAAVDAMGNRLTENQLAVLAAIREDEPVDAPELAAAIVAALPADVTVQALVTALLDAQAARLAE